MINKIMINTAPSYLNNLFTINSNNTRSQNKLIIHKPLSNFQRTSISIAVPKLWNKLPSNLRENAIIFKKEKISYFANNNINNKN